MPVRDDDLSVRVILCNAQYHTRVLISDYAKEKISKQPPVIAGEPETTLHVNNKITSMF